MLGAIARGTTRITNLAPGADVAATIACLRGLGVSIEAAGPARLVIKGGGWDGTSGAPRCPLDAGNSGTTMRLMAGLLAGRPLTVTITGDASLRRRPMRRVIEPLAAMGASIESEQGPGAARPSPAGRSRASSGGPPVASAQVKSALMLAALSAPPAGRPSVTRDRRRRAITPNLRSRPSASQVSTNGLQRHASAGRPGGNSAARRAALEVPGDPRRRQSGRQRPPRCPGHPSQLTGVCLNPRRLGFVRALPGMGARHHGRSDGRGRGRAGRTRPGGA